MENNKVSFIDQNELFHLVIRLPKNDAAFLYFTLEANEGLCFYSTADHEPHSPFREVIMKGSIEFRNATLKVLESLKKKITFELLVDEVIKDN